MPNIENVKNEVAEFFKKALKTNAIKIVTIKKMVDGWKVVAEVYEESAFIKSLGLPTKVQDRNIYECKLDNDLEIQSYEKNELVHKE